MIGLMDKIVMRMVAELTIIPDMAVPALAIAIVHTGLIRAAQFVYLIRD